jgi:hypothetical protein
MNKKKIKSTAPEPPLKLDMPFDEALKRFIATDPKELEESMEQSKKENAEQKKENPVRRRS